MRTPELDGCRFLWFIQMLHDNEPSWNEQGLTEEGLTMKAEIIKLFIL